MAMILSSAVGPLVQKLAPLIEEEVVMLFGVKGELVKLQAKLQLIESVLEDAEKKAFHDPAIRHWTARLKDVVYDADDVIDEFQTKQLILVSSSNYSSLSSARRLALRHKIGRRIKNINLKLEEISKEKAQFQLLSSTNSTTDQPSRASRMSSPTVESDIVGSTIEEDTKKLVDMLTKEDTQRGSGGVPVFAIAGIGGIGKTTLAQLIYNDPDITSTFSVKAWVCVSKEFSEEDLLKRILTSVGVHHAGFQTLDLLVPAVENAFNGKKFLIMLDDVWREQVWENLLRNPLQRGASGSRILVTTRNRDVALGMKAVPEHIHSMQLLSPEDGWSLICKKVVSNGEEGELENLKDIGLKIVKKCGGLPLAIKTIGGVLRKKDRNRRAWEGVLYNTTWSLTGLPEDVNRALYLSYEDLPPYLKQCFLYCALFPEDDTFQMNRLVRYWISEGFVRAEGDLTLEDVGEEYYRELVERSFLQPDENYLVEASKMHDLLWSLAQFLSKDESLFVHKGLTRSSTSNILVKPTRRISVVGVGHEEIRSTFEILKKDKSLRTLLTFKFNWHGAGADEVTKHFKRLRVLDLSGNEIERLPHSIGNLVHLRYLDLSGSSIGKLPKSTEKLVNLQFMILDACQKLRNLGNGIVKLQNLRCLDLDRTWKLEGMPIGIGKLKNLNTISGFVVNNNNRKWGSLEEVKSLSMLRSLSIRNLKRAAEDVESYRGGGGGYDILKDKKHLSDLKLVCYSGFGVEEAEAEEEEMKKRIEEVFELLLCPPPGLEELLIRGYCGIRFPSWMTSAPSFLPNLRRLDLYSCDYCGILPPLGNLPNLEFLSIGDASSVKAIGDEFLGHKTPAAAASDALSPSSSTCSVLFPKLTQLEFMNMPNLEKWEWEEEEEEEKTKKNVASMSVLPRLITMILNGCPKLRSLPVGLAQNATSLTKMVIAFCRSLVQVSSFPFLKELIIKECPNLENILDLPSLQHLALIDDRMERLPEWLLVGGGQQQFPALQKLQFESSISLLRRCLEEGSPDWSKIQHFPSVYGSCYSRSGRDKYFSYTRSSSDGGPKPLFNTNILDDDVDSE